MQPLDKETRLFIRLALIGIGIIAIALAFYGNPKEDAAALAWFALP